MMVKAHGNCRLFVLQFSRVLAIFVKLGGTMPVKLIAHVLLTVADSHLIIQRSQIKRGKPNVFPQYWDIPGGRVEENELPRDAAVRECFEETGILIAKENLTIIHEDSQFDEEKEAVFTRLVYEVKLSEQPQQFFLTQKGILIFYGLLVVMKTRKI